MTPNPFLQKLSLVLVAGLALPSLAKSAALEKASVTEAVNVVSYQSSADAAQKPAGTGTVIYPSNIVRTGIGSRAELQFNDDTVTRMGANSVFSFDEKSQTMNLQRGSVLFCKPKTADTFQISTPAATCSISGTTGFLSMTSIKGHLAMIFGLIEGHAPVTVGGKTFPIGTGQLLVTTDGGVRVLDFDIASFLAHAGLIVKFKSTLPNSGAINHALARFEDLKRRGFIETTGFNFAMDSKGQELAYTVNGENSQPLMQIANQIEAQIIQQGKGGQQGPVTQPTPVDNYQPPPPPPNPPYTPPMGSGTF